VVSLLPGERNGERTGIMSFIAVRGVDEIKHNSHTTSNKKALIIRAFLLLTL
jgi:hypothetical protein